MGAVQKKYRVKAIWPTLQGEGFWAGRPALFVRLVGCNLWSGYAADRSRDAARNNAACPLWCDTDFTKEDSCNYTADELVTALQATSTAIRFCVITGGEPLLQVDAALMRALHQAGFTVAIETNGTVAVGKACWDAATNQVEAPDWIVCSPKLPPESLQLEYCDELKLVVPDYQPADFARFAKRVRAHEVGGHSVQCLWLQPEDGPRLGEATQQAVAYALAHPAWRVSVQTHKVLGVD